MRAAGADALVMEELGNSLMVAQLLTLQRIPALLGGASSSGIRAPLRTALAQVIIARLLLHCRAISFIMGIELEVNFCG